MLPRRLALTIAVIALLPGLAMAEERGAALMAFLARLPPALMAPGAKSDIHFADLDATATHGTWPAPAPGFPVGGKGVFARIDLPAFDQALGFSTADTLRQVMGFGPDDLVAALSVTDGPATGQILLLRQGTAANLGPALDDQRYQPSPLGDIAVYLRGDTDATADPTAASPYDPFGAGQGMSSRVAIEGDTVYQANAWPMIEGMLIPVAPPPELATLAAALNDPDFGQVTGPRGAALFQATLLTDQSGMSAPSAAGIPPWKIGLLADMVMAKRNLTVAIFAYDTRAEADAAQAALTNGWDRAVFPGGPTGTETLGYVLAVSPTVKALGDGPAAVILTVALPAPEPSGLAPAGAWHNKTYDMLLKSIRAGKMPLFGPT